MTFNYVSLFSGIGGFEQALNRLGGTCVMASEIDKYANQAYEILYGHPTVGDVTKVAADDVPNHDLLVGGFPCQAFSVAGKRLGFDDTRGTLFFEIARIAKVKRPKAMLLENVKGLISHDSGKTLDTIIQTLGDIGYTVDFNVMNSKYFGVPQNRERIFIVAIRDDLIEPGEWNVGKRSDVVAKGKRRIGELEGVKTFNFDWPAQEEVTVRLRDILESDVDERFYLSEEKTAKLVAQLEKNDSDVKFVGGIDNGSKWLDDGKTYSRNFKQGNRVYDADGIGTSLTSQPVGGLGGPTSLYQIEPQMLGHDAIKRVSPTPTTMGGGHREPNIAERIDGLPIREATKQGYAIAQEGDAVNFQFPDSETRRGRVGKQVAQTLEASGINQGVVEYSRKDGIGKGRDIALCLSASDWRGLNRNQTQNAVLEVRQVLMPDLEKGQNGRGFKDNDEEAFTLTAQDRPGIALSAKSIGNTNPSGNGMNGQIFDINAGLAPTLTTNKGEGVKITEAPRYRIRKLTPRECFRLQGFPDSEFDKLTANGISNSQLYKMAGNAVTVNVIDAIGRRLLPLIKEAE